MIASNLSGLASNSPRVTSHHVAVFRQGTLHDCNNDPSGRVAACQVASKVFDDFLTSKTCNGRPACAIAESMIYGAKHKTSLLDLLGRGMTILQVGQWMWELQNWCTGSGFTTCGPIISSGMCEIEDYACVNGELYNLENGLSTAVDDGLTVEAGDTEYLISTHEDAFPGGWYTAYDPLYGDGSWGVMAEAPVYGLCFGVGTIC